ncbi:hypothetical protein ACFV7R_15315 [Streptomyces sp. NPDC059866]
MSKAETFRRLHRGRPPGSSSTRAPTAYPIGAPPDVLPLLRDIAAGLTK